MQQKNTRKKSLVIVADTLFYPPRRNGFSIRYYPLILELSKLGYSIDLIVVNKYRDVFINKDITGLDSICNEVDVIELASTDEPVIHKLLQKLSNAVRALLPAGIPYHLIDNHRRSTRNAILDIISKRTPYDFGIGVGVGGLNADLLLSLKKGIRPNKIICDFVDSAFLLKTRSRTHGNTLFSLFSLYDTWKTRHWEQTINHQCPTIYISPEDARTVAPDTTVVIPNCVVTEGYSAAKKLNLPTPNIAFLGNMSYPPNIEACIYLVEEILPLVRERIPGVCLHIIGRNPDKKLLALCNDDHIHVTGEVDNIWDYISSCDAFVLPMITGAGLQNKVLEAMYAGKPVITSPIGNEGINAQHARDIYIATCPDEYADFIQRALSNPGAMGDHAMTFVVKNFSSHRMALDFDLLLGKLA